MLRIIVHTKSIYFNYYKLKKNFKKTVTFLTGYIGFFKITDKYNKFYFKRTITDGNGFIQIAVPPSAYEIESVNIEIKGIIINEKHYTKSNYPFTIQPIFSTLGSNIKISPQGPLISFIFDDSVQDLSGFNARTLYEQFTSSFNPADVLSFDSFFLGSDIPQLMIFKGEKPGNIHNFTMDVVPGYKYIEKFRGGVQR